MKCIRKRGAPHGYRMWLKRVRGTQDDDYRKLRNPVKAELHRALLEEQGYICAYTMKRISTTDSHIEHIKPETRCRADQLGSDLNYDNLVACFPREGMERRYRYGAQQKDDWWEDNGDNFVSPLCAACETRFRFNMAGEIAAVENNRDGLLTIQVLRLDHKSLTEERKLAIEEFLYGENRDAPLSSAQARRARRAVMKPDPDGRMTVFCVAIMHALEDHESQLAKAAKSKRYARMRG